MNDRRLKFIKILLILVLVAAFIIPAVVQAAVDDSYTKALLHFDGTNYSTSFIDESGKTWTASGSVDISTDNHKFGNAAGSFDGTNLSFLSINDDSDFVFGNGDFTIDFWVYPTSPSETSTSILLAKVDNVTHNSGYSIFMPNGTYDVKLSMSSSGSSWNLANSATVGTLTQFTWSHVAIVRSGTNVYAFLDGVLGSTSTISTNPIYDNSYPLLVGGGNWNNTYYTGYMDELRISKGIARWTSAFTPPSSPYGIEATLTPSQTRTPTTTSTVTPTGSVTPTITRTPTIAPTSVYGEVIWAVGPVTLSGNIKAAIETLLHDAPPSGAQGNIYASTYISGVDTLWNISLANLVGVVDPYTDWNIETEAVLQFSVTCAGTDPTFTCGYFEPPAAGGNTSLGFPWKTGFSAQYGVSGVHAGSGVIPGSSAVDFLGRDSVSGSMPPLAVAAASGTIDWVCGDSIGMAIRVIGGPVYLAYYHFAPGQDFSIGQAVSQGQVLGSLIYGSFSGTSACQEYGTQASDQYHLHFVFLPTSSGYLEIGGCVLDLSTQKFVCNGNTYSIGDYIPNGGDVSDPHPPPDDGGSGGGGVHIWDGIVAAIVELASGSINKYLPAQQPLFGYVMAKINLITFALMSMVTAYYLTGLSGSFMMFFTTGLIYLELVYLSASLLVGLAKLIF